MRYAIHVIDKSGASRIFVVEPLRFENGDLLVNRNGAGERYTLSDIHDWFPIDTDQTDMAATQWWRSH